MFCAQYIIRLLQIGELEGEIALLKQQLSHATEQRETLQSQLDSLTSQLALMETQLHREKAKSIEAQVTNSLLFQDDYHLFLLHTGQVGAT